MKKATTLPSTASGLILCEISTHVTQHFHRKRAKRVSKCNFLSRTAEALPDVLRHMRNLKADSVVSPPVLHLASQGRRSGGGPRNQIDRHLSLSYRAIKPPPQRQRKQYTNLNNSNAINTIQLQPYPFVASLATAKTIHDGSYLHRSWNGDCREGGEEKRSKTTKEGERRGSLSRTADRNEQAPHAEGERQRCDSRHLH